MRTIENLTELETKVLKSCVKGMYAECGFSDFGFDDLSSDLNISTKILRGVVSSLVKKDLLEVGEGDFKDIIFLTGLSNGLVEHWLVENPHLQPTQIK